MGDQGSHRDMEEEEHSPLPDGLIEAVVQTLQPLVGDAPDDLSRRLRTVAVRYHNDLSIQQFWGKPGEQRRALHRLLKSLDSVLAEMRAVSAEYAVALSALAQREPGEEPPEDLFLQTREDVIRLGNAIVRFDTNYAPNRGPPTDLPLEEAVRELIDIVAPITGERPQVQLNKHKGSAPALKSRGALAIGALLRGILPSLPETKIANMIEKVRRQPRPSESHLEAIWRVDPDFELGLALPRGMGD